MVSISSVVSQTTAIIFRTTLVFLVKAPRFDSPCYFNISECLCWKLEHRSVFVVEKFSIYRLIKTHGIRRTRM